MHKKILLILPYFGKFPNYFNLFLQSVRNNPGVTLLIFTDQQIDSDGNIMVNRMTWERFIEFVQSKFEYPVNLHAPYKICDLRPSFGHIFDDYIQEYDYWGHCDCDLIFGDMRLLNPMLDYGYDRIGMWGHLILYRNSIEVNNWFHQLDVPKGTPLFHEAVAMSKSMFYDEFGGMNKIADYNEVNQCTERLFDDINFRARNFYSKRPGNGIDMVSHRTPMIFEYDNGHLYRHYCIKRKWRRDESLYCHLQKRKMAVDDGIDAGKYFIVPNRFVCRGSSPAPTEPEMRSMSAVPLIDLKYLKAVWGFNAIVFMSKTRKRIKRIFGVKGYCK